MVRRPPGAVLPFVPFCLQLSLVARNQALYLWLHALHRQAQAVQSGHTQRPAYMHQQILEGLH